VARLALSWGFSPSLPFYFIILKLKSMRFFGFFLLCWTASLPVRAEEPADSLSVVDLAEVEVKGVRASKAAPFAVSEVNGQDLDGFSKTGRELPFLFSRTPGVLAWSENGMGTGTTYLRVRGSDDTHVNVTLDGIPLNSPEDQRVFWANMNSYASLLGNVQIQRGVGTSSNGDGAFGSTVAMSSRFPSLKPSAEITGSWGSYGTWRAGGNFSTGLLARHWVMDGLIMRPAPTVMYTVRRADRAVITAAWPIWATTS